MKKLQQQQHCLLIFLMIAAYIDWVTGLNCPTPASISPCTCQQYTYYGTILVDNSIFIDCKGRNLTDSKLSSILNTFLFSPGLSPVLKISAAQNQLTRVPNQISKFPAVLVVDLSVNRISEIPCDDGQSFIKNRFTNGSIQIDLGTNEITRIPSRVFNFPFASNVEILLQYNKITSIASGAFIFPSASRVFIYLSYNQMSAIPDGIFNFANALTVILIIDGNKISAISSGTFNFPMVRELTIRLGYNNLSSIPLDTFNFPTSSSLKHIDIGLPRNHITTIPCGIFNYPLINGGIALFLGENKITTVPSCAFNFPSATSISLYLSYNLITTISNGAFHFPSASYIHFSLGNNFISTLPPNTFVQGRYYDLSLQNNLLKRFDSTVFKLPLNNLDSYNEGKTHGFLDIRGNPIDCSTDPCHLAWIFQSSNSSQLRSHIKGYDICSNRPKNDYTAPPFSALNSFDFSQNCQCSYD